MTTKPNEMSDEELYQSITDICFENGGVTKPMADKLMLLVKQHREAYALEIIGEDEDYLKDPTPAFEGAYDTANQMIESQNILRAELREKVGKL